MRFETEVHSHRRIVGDSCEDTTELSSDSSNYEQFAVDVITGREGARFSSRIESTLRSIGVTRTI